MSRGDNHDESCGSDSLLLPDMPEIVNKNPVYICRWGTKQVVKAKKEKEIGLSQKTERSVDLLYVETILQELIRSILER